MSQTSTALGSGNIEDDIDGNIIYENNTLVFAVDALHPHLPCPIWKRFVRLISCDDEQVYSQACRQVCRQAYPSAQACEKGWQVSLQSQK